MILTTFSLDEKEQQKLNEWLKTKDLNEYTGAIGSRFTYSFTPTSLGTVVKVYDNLHRTEIDLTDYDMW